MTTKPLPRRAFLRAVHNLLGGLALSSLAGSGYMRWMEPRWFAVERVTLTLPRLPRAFDGITVAQLSDLHLGPVITPEHVHAAIDLTLSLRPDLIALTGDFVSDLSHGEAGQLTEALRRLTAPHSVFGVLGNHDWWTDARVVAEAVSRAGVVLLRNQHHAVRRGGESLYLAGVDDFWEGHADLGRALAGIPDGAAIVLLAHEPDYADRVSRHMRVGLQLSGHSHGGQVRFPFIGPVALPPHGRRYPAGLYALDEMQLYTNRGVGMVKPAVRFNCRPEITLITLRSLEQVF
ncbi:MAG: metallophosphoesterase [Anaerolineales bacterium]